MYDYLFNFCVLFHCSFVQMVIDLSWSSLFSRRSYNRCVHPILSSSVISFRWCCRFYTSSSSSHFFLDPITFTSVISSIRFFPPCFWSDLYVICKHESDGCFVLDSQVFIVLYETVETCGSYWCFGGWSSQSWYFYFEIFEFHFLLYNFNIYFWFASECWFRCKLSIVWKSFRKPACFTGWCPTCLNTSIRVSSSYRCGSKLINLKFFIFMRSSLQKIMKTSAFCQDHGIWPTIRQSHITHIYYLPYPTYSCCMVR